MPVEPVDLSGKTILIAGPTGQVAAPIVSYYASRADVHVVARFQDPKVRAELDALGVITHQADIAERREVATLPAAVDYLFNFATVKTGDFAYDMAVNAEGVGNLISHCRQAKAALHCSSAGVYQYAGQQLLTEDAPLGDNHRGLMPTYSLAKIAAESVARFAAKQQEMPLTIARLSVPYGRQGGWPLMHLQMMKAGMPIDVHPERPNRYNLLHEQDYLRMVPYLLAAATTEVTCTNWGGSTPTAIEEWCAYMGELTGLTPTYRDNPAMFGSLAIDTTQMEALLGPTEIDWREGIRDMIEVNCPALLLPQYR